MSGWGRDVRDGHFLRTRKQPQRQTSGDRLERSIEPGAIELLRCSSREIRDMRKALICCILGIVSIPAATALLRAQGDDDSNAGKPPNSQSVGSDEAASSGSSFRSDPIARLLEKLDAAGAGGFPGMSWGNGPAHYEFVGMVQWKDTGSNNEISTGNQTINFGSRIGLGGFAAGPLVRFLWKPSLTVLGARMSVRVEYGQIIRARTRTITLPTIFGGQIFPVSTALRSKISTKSFQAAWSPMWGTDKFRIGPYVAYQRLDVAFTLTNETSGAPPPISREVRVPNDVGYIGGNFDAYPIKQVAIYGWAGAVPCCGSGWHLFDSEAGVKYYFVREFSITAGYRYSYLKRDFTIPPVTVLGVVIYPGSSGFLKIPGGGPFVGLSFRF